MKTLDKKEKEKLIVRMIQDCIIFDRVSEKLFGIVNVIEPRKQEQGFWAAHSFQGLDNIYLLMGIKDESLKLEIDEKYHNLYNGDENVKSAAEKIYVEWLVEIRNHYTKEKENNLTKV